MIVSLRILLVLFAACALHTCGAAESPRRVALLVGVDKYDKPGFRDLQFAEKDVQAVGKSLTALGFEVTILHGSGKAQLRATRQNIVETAQKLVEPLTRRDLVVVMLSGHGQQLSRVDGDHERDESYFCPVDAQVNKPETQVSLSHLLDEVLVPNAGRRILLVDACRDVPTDPSRGARSARGIEGRTVSLPEDTAVFFSCRAGQQSYERHEVGHGLFTHCLLGALNGGAATADGEIAWADVVAYVNRQMVSPSLTKYMPRTLPQEPIPAGALPHTVLGRVTPKPESPTPKVPSVPPSTASKPPTSKPTPKPEPTKPTGSSNRAATTPPAALLSVELRGLRSSVGFTRATDKTSTGAIVLNGSNESRTFHVAPGQQVQLVFRGLGNTATIDASVEKSTKFEVEFKGSTNTLRLPTDFEGQLDVQDVGSGNRVLGRE